MNLETMIEKRIGEVRADSINLTFGEIINLHKTKEMIIQPEYQRLFRWSIHQQSRLIESILLEFPIPQIFVIENDDGVFEVIDGLQRICSMLHFIASEELPKELNLEPLTLDGCEVINDLNGIKYTDLPQKLRLRLKRTSIRTIVIRGQSKSNLKYEMFKRLNTGGSLLSHQEIRNCTARMVVPKGVEFYKLLKDLAADPNYKACIETIAASDKEQKADEELVLRFFAAKNALDIFKGSIRDWLDDYMEGIILGTISFDFEKEKADFLAVFSHLAGSMAEGSFVKYKNNKPIGGLAPAYYEAVTIGVYRNLPKLATVPVARIQEAIVSAVQLEAFREFTGPGANSKEKQRGRIDFIDNVLRAI